MSTCCCKPSRLVAICLGDLPGGVEVGQAGFEFDVAHVSVLETSLAAITCRAACKPTRQRQGRGLDRHNDYKLGFAPVAVDPQLL